MEMMLTLLFASLSILSVMAIFRWKAHDELINIRAKIAAEFAREFHPHLESLSNIIRTQYETYDGAKQFLESTIRSIEEENKLLEGKSYADESNVAKLLVNQGYAISVIKEYVNTLTNLGGKTHDIRRYFNWPFYVSLLALLLYVIQKYAVFEALVAVMLIISVFYSLYGFYCLFNFSYNPGETDGFDRLPEMVKGLRFIRKNPKD